MIIFWIIQRLQIKQNQISRNVHIAGVVLLFLLGNGLFQPYPSLTLSCEWSHSVSKITFKDMVHSLWPNDAIGWHTSGPTFVLAIACCLTAPIHYLNQCWLSITEAFWHWAEGNFTETVPAITHFKVFETHMFKNIDTCPKRQWLNITQNCLNCNNTEGSYCTASRWYHDMETLSALLTLCEGDLLVCGPFFLTWLNFNPSLDK